MCCETTTTHHGQQHGHGGSCGCSGSSCHGPSFWSKKKRVRMLEHSLKCLRERAKDMEELLEELKEEN